MQELNHMLPFGHNNFGFVSFREPLKGFDQRHDVILVCVFKEFRWLLCGDWKAEAEVGDQWRG